METTTNRKMLKAGMIPPAEWNREHETNVSNRLRAGAGYKRSRTKLGTTLRLTRQTNRPCALRLVVTPVLSLGVATGDWQLEARGGANSVMADDGVDQFAHWTPTLGGTATDAENPPATVALPLLLSGNQAVYLETTWADTVDAGGSQTLTAAPTIELVAGLGGAATVPASTATVERIWLGDILWPSPGAAVQRPFFEAARCVPLELCRPGTGTAPSSGSSSSPPTYTPPFDPTQSGLTLRIGAGYVYAAREPATDDAHQVPKRHQHPWLPWIGAYQITDPLAVLTLTDNAKNNIWLKVTLVERTTIIGDTEITATPGPGYPGARVYGEGIDQSGLETGGTTADATHNHTDPVSGVTGDTNPYPSNHVHTIPDLSHAHSGITRIAQLNYHVHETNNPPAFQVTLGAAEPLDDDPTERFVYFGYYTFVAGVVTAWEWIPKENFNVTDTTYFKDLASPSANPSNV